MSNLLPYLASYNSNITPIKQDIAELLGGKILICTDSGFKWIDITELENHKKSIPSEHYKCPLCYLTANSSHAIFSSEFSLVNHELILATIISYSNSNRDLSSSIASHIQPRAPPLAFVI